jgi:Skp family chaperone for outer membrane proteins
MNDLADIHIEHYFPKGYDPDAEPWKSIKAHYNTALAAMRTDLEDMKRLYQDSYLYTEPKLREALAAEREKRKQVDAMMLDAYDKAKAIRTELAAEREQKCELMDELHTANDRLAFNSQLS